jgi:preprotein translocase subunit YajC
MELIFPIAIFALVYLLLFRPQQQRAKNQRKLIDSLEVGDEIVTIGGLLGTIVDLNDLNVEVEVANGVRVRVVRPAISGRVPPVEPEPESSDVTETDTDTDTDEP